MKRVSKLELINSLRSTMISNTNAIDYIENEINRVSDILSYNSEDMNAKDDLENLEYIKFCLYYLDKQYMKSFKQAGGKI